MIHPDSLKIEWMEQASKKHGKADKILLEKMVRALYLLELLQKSGLEFIFKGGTALSLIIQQLGRFSIDIDIIIMKKPSDLKAVLDQIINNSDFISFEEDKRETGTHIDKAHFKFFYKPVTSTKLEKEYILLDILFESSPYGQQTMHIPIESAVLKLDGNQVNVLVPTPEAILGDKLTAYAPNTTGIPYGKNKAMEIIKQLFDIGKLFDQVRDIESVSRVFNRTAEIELKYRDLKESPEDVLKDVQETSLCITTRGKDGKGDFSEIQSGIRSIKNYIFSESLHIEKIMIPAAKAAYMAALIQSGEKQVKRFSDPLEIKDWTIKAPFSTRLNKLKKTNPEAFYYWYQATMLLDEN